MSNVLKFAKKEEQQTVERLHGECLCHNCGHEWEGNAPVGATELQCPKCQRMMGLFKYPCEPVESWICNCGCHLFVISPNGALCWKCGTSQKF